MCKRKFGQIRRARRRTNDLAKKNRARGGHNEMWMVALDAGFGSNTLVTGERFLGVAGVRDQRKGMTKSHRIPLLERVYGMDNGMDCT